MISDTSRLSHQNPKDLYAPKNGRIRIRPWVLILVGIISAISLIYRTFSYVPLIKNPSVTPSAMEQIKNLYTRSNFGHLSPGESEAISINQTDLSAVLEFANSVVNAGNAAVFIVNDSILIRGTFIFRLHPTIMYINFDIDAKIQITNMQPSLRLESFQIGSWSLPVFIIQPLIRKALDWLWSSSAYRQKLKMVTDLKVRNSKLVISYTYPDVPVDFLSLIPGGLLKSGKIKPEFINETVNHILLSIKGKLVREDVFSIIIQQAFKHVTLLKRRGLNSIKANRIALYSVGGVMGNPLITKQTESAHRQKFQMGLTEKDIEKIQIYQRHDWAKHFISSAIITAMAGQEMAEIVGTNKEINDFSGSGFSFGDLLADQAGISFAKLILKSESTASAIQNEIARGFKIRDYFPNLDALPENLTASEFERRFGSVIGPEYKKLVWLIERSVAKSPAYLPCFPAKCDASRQGVNPN